MSNTTTAAANAQTESCLDIDAAMLMSDDRLAGLLPSAWPQTNVKLADFALDVDRVDSLVGYLRGRSRSKAAAASRAVP